jgi:hypothetical protein
MLLFILLIGISAIVWATYSLKTGKAHYIWTPPGGHGRHTSPLYFWTPTIVLYICGAYLVLLGLGLVR